MAVVALLLMASACNGRVSEGGDSGGDAGDGEFELAEACIEGCTAFRACYEEGYEQLYPQDDCEAECEMEFDECEPEALDYANCVVDLECGAWPDLVEDPALTECGPAWSEFAGCRSMTPGPADP